MRAVVVGLFLALGAVGLPATTISAEPQAVRSNEPYLALYEAMFAHFDQQAFARSQTVTLISTAIEHDPTLQGLEKSKPHLRQRMQTAAEPYVKRWLERSIAMQQERAIGAFSARMSPAEAMTSARFYRSPLGQKVVQTIMRNYEGTNVAKAVAETGRLDARAAAADRERAIARGAAQIRFTPAELRQGKTYLASPAAKKFNEAMITISELSISQPPLVASPEEQQQAREAMTEAVRNYLAEP